MGRRPLSLARLDDDREALRARLFLRAVLPLLEVVTREAPFYRRLMRGESGVVQFEVAGSSTGAYLTFASGELLGVVPALHARPTVKLGFPAMTAMNAFFAGRASLPRVSGLRRPLLLGKVLVLLSSLRVLTPGEGVADADARALRVKLLLRLIPHALSQLNQAGYPPMRALTEGSPDRVYQWSVEERGLGAYLRMRDGRTRAGSGTYPHRAPFVHYLFPTIESAFRVFTTQGSQVDAVREGHIRTEGSPEYSRKLGQLMQSIDEILMG